MTTGRINQVATSRPVPDANPARSAQCPHRAPLPLPPCPRADRVFSRDNRLFKISVAKNDKPSPVPSLATRADQPPCFVLPSCCFPRAQLSHSIRLSASIAELSAGPKTELGQSEPSVRGARSFTPSRGKVVAAAFSRDRFGVNAGHCLKTRCFLRRPTAKRAGVDYLIGTGLNSARRDLLLEPGAEPFRLEVVPTSRSEAALGCITLEAACRCRPLHEGPHATARPAARALTRLRSRARLPLRLRSARSAARTPQSAARSAQ